MDEIVARSLLKWPNVPAVYGWLQLDRRGNWRIKGETIGNAALRDFIGRNYQADEKGRWYFQNGPQRVYVELEAAPLIWGVERDAAGDFVVQAHTGSAAGRIEEAWVDEHGRLFLQAAGGFGLVRSPDMHVAADAVGTGLWRPRPVAFEELPVRYGYVLSPQRVQTTP